MSDPTVEASTSEEPLVWSLPGIPQTPVRTITLILIVPLSAAIGFVYTRQPIFALLGPAFLAPVLTRYFLKPSYRLTTEFARASWGTGQTEIRWQDVRSVLETEGGLQLSPLAKQDIRQRFRGVELILPKDEELRARIATFVREAIPESVAYEP